MGEPAFEAHHFVPIYRALNEAKVNFIIIGGQACNLWSLFYENRFPDLKEYRPYTTKDLDIWASSQREVLATADLLHVNAELNDPSSPAPGMGNLVYKSPKGPLFVQFLNGAFGVETKLVVRTRQNYVWKKYRLKLSVMHPVLTIKAKLRSVYGLHQRGRQDLRHLKMAILYTPAFLLDRIAEGQIKAALDMFQYIIDLAKSADGLRLYRQKRIPLEQALPVDDMQRSKSPKIKNFLNMQLPREITRLEKIRAK